MQTLMVTEIGLGVLALGIYVWYLWALSKLFPRLGLESKHAWIPFYNEWKLFERGGLPGWLVLLTLVPAIGLLIVWLVRTFVIYRLNLEFGLPEGHTVVGALLPPLWAMIVDRDLDSDRLPLTSPRFVSETDQYSRDFLATMAGTQSDHDERDRDERDGAGYDRERGGDDRGDTSRGRDAQGGVSREPDTRDSGVDPSERPTRYTLETSEAAQHPAEAVRAPEAPRPAASDRPAASEHPAAETPAMEERDGSGKAEPQPAVTAREPQTKPAQPRSEEASTAGQALNPEDLMFLPRDLPTTPEQRTDIFDSLVAAQLQRAPKPADPERSAAEGAEAKAAETPSSATAGAETPSSATAGAETATSESASAATAGTETASSDTAASIDETAVTSSRAAARGVADLEDHTVVVPRVRSWVLELPDGSTLRLPGTDVILGRRPEGRNAVTIPDATRTLSKTHARLVQRDGDWFVEDLGSTNGLVLIDADGARIEVTPGTLQPVSERMVLGTLELKLRPE